MFIKYMKTLAYKIKNLDKKATNPFTNLDSYNPNQSIHIQTYIWITKGIDKKSNSIYLDGDIIS